MNYIVPFLGIQQSDSVLHLQVSLLFHILFPYKLLQNIEQSSLCCTVGPCWLSILYTGVCPCQSINIYFMIFSHNICLQIQIFLSAPEWEGIDIHWSHRRVKYLSENMFVT